MDTQAHVKLLNDYSIQHISLSLPLELYSSQICRRADETYTRDNLGNSILVLQLLLLDICKIFSRFGYIVFWISKQAKGVCVGGGSGYK